MEGIIKQVESPLLRLPFHLPHFLPLPLQITKCLEAAMLEDEVILRIGSQGICLYRIQHTTDFLKFLTVRGCLTQHQAKKLMNLRQEQNFTLLDTLNSLDTNMETSQQTSLLAILDGIQTTSQKGTQIVKYFDITHKYVNVLSYM